jgi:hypothetical protein
MFWFSFFCVAIVILIVVNREIKNNCEKELKKGNSYYENNVCRAFYNATDRYLKLYAVFKEETKELKASYMYLLSLNKLFAEGKDGIKKLIEMWRTKLEKEDERLKELEKVDKKKYLLGMEKYTEQSRFFNILYENYIDDGKVFNNNRLLDDASHILEVRELFNNYCVELAKEKKRLNIAITLLNEKKASLMLKQNNVMKEKENAKNEVERVEDEGRTIMLQREKIIKETQKIVEEIEEIDAECLELKKECQNLIVERRKLKDATSKWEYF